MASVNDGEPDHPPNDISMNIVVHYEDDFFIIEEDDTDKICYMNLKASIHATLKFDCEVRLYMFGECPGERKLALYDDSTVLLWLKENDGDRYIHVHVDVLKSRLLPMIEDPVDSNVDVNGSDGSEYIDGSDSDDESYTLSDVVECEIEFCDEVRLGDLENDDMGLGEGNEYDSDCHVPGTLRSDSDQEETYIDRAYRGRIFKKSADGKITLERGMLFSTVYEYRAALKDYVIQEGFQIVRIRNERTRVTATCAAQGCEWYIHASTNPDGSSFQIKVYDDKHTCVKCNTNSKVTSTWIAEKMLPQFRADPNMSYRAIAEHLISNYGVTVSRPQMYRAKKKAEEMVEGNYGKSYSKLRKYAYIVREANPGTLASLHVERMELSHNPSFKRFFLCLDAKKKGFKIGCRPFLGMDGCHLKGPFGGVLLTVVSLDGNNGLFPVAFAIAEAENTDSWTWFIHLLESCIADPTAKKPLIIMSDRQKGLVQAIADVIPYAKNRWCCRHLYNNFKSKFPGVMLRTLFWRAAKTYIQIEFEETMAEIKKIIEDAHKWLHNIQSDMWARHAFHVVAKSDHITNNCSESFNNWLGVLRSKPVLTLVETVVTKVMNKVQERFADSCTWISNLTPVVEKKMDSLRLRTNRCSMVAAGHMEFLVTDNNIKYPVNLKNHTCICNAWQHTGLPCKHALACIYYLRHDISAYCDEYYSKASYQLAYNEIVHPVADLSMVNLPEVCVDTVLPPILKRFPGRPRKKRRLEEAESKASGTGRRSTTVKCKNCKEFGHNTRTCQRAPVANKNKGKTRSKSKVSIQESQASTVGTAATTSKKSGPKRKTTASLGKATRSKKKAPSVRDQVSAPTTPLNPQFQPCQTTNSAQP